MAAARTVCYRQVASKLPDKERDLFLSFCRVLNVNYSFLVNSPASDF